jgi:hypothetical protein
MHIAAARTWRGGGGAENWKWLFLIRKLNVHEGGKSLHGCGVLCMIEEISMAGLELRVPVDDIELRTCLRTLLRSLWTFAITTKRSLGLEIEGKRRWAGVRVKRHSSKSRGCLASCTLRTGCWQ